MAATIRLEIVSPEELLFSEQVDMAGVPASEGDMGVLAGHAPMVVALRAGAVRAYEGAAVRKEFFVMGGFAEVTAERCTVVATEAVPAEQFTDGWIAERVREAEEAYERLALTGDVDAREEALKKKLIGTMRAGMGG